MSLLGKSYSDECMSPHSYNVVPEAKSWDMSVLDQIEKDGEKSRQKSRRSKISSDYDGKSSAKISFWKLFLNSVSCSSVNQDSLCLPPLTCDMNGLLCVSTDLSTCPQCSRVLFYQENKETKFPPFCTDCQTYFVSEADAGSKQLDDLINALSSDDFDDASSPDRLSKGKIVVLQENALVSCPTLCGSNTKQINLKSPTICVSKLCTCNLLKGSTETRENKERRLDSLTKSVAEMTSANTLDDDDTHLNKSIHVKCDYSDGSEMMFSFSGCDESTQLGGSIYTENEATSIYNDVHQV